MDSAGRVYNHGMNGGYVAAGNKKQPIKLYSRVTKKPIKNAPQASNKNTNTPKTTPPVFPNIKPFKAKSKPLPMAGKTTAK